MPLFKQGDLFEAPGVHIVTASSASARTTRSSWDWADQSMNPEIESLLKDLPINIHIWKRGQPLRDLEEQKIAFLLHPKSGIVARQLAELCGMIDDRLSRGTKEHKVRT